MKRLVALALAAAVFAVPAAQASAAKAPKAPTLAQFNALKKQVTSLQKQVKEAQDTAQAGIVLTFCLNAVAADALQGTWQSVDTLAQAQGRPAIFGPQTPIGDANFCQLLEIARSHNVPPHTGAFAALIALAGPSADALRMPSFSALNLLLG